MPGVMPRAKAPTLKQLWDEAGFKPNPNQKEAILHTEGPLYLPAGPGSGKTRVLLWRTLNLIVFHGLKPEEIYLSTFTEKAALQLREGLRGLLGMVTSQTGQPYDISRMYVGTVHSLCQRLILDRRFYPNRQRRRAPALLDDLGQYFYLYKLSQWSKLLDGIAFGDDPNSAISSLFGENSSSRHKAVTNVIGLFNRLSEEVADPKVILDRADTVTLRRLLKVYARYLESLASNGAVPRTDFSLLQQRALQLLEDSPGTGSVFKYVIVDEYQDTNTVQERIFFRLAAGHKNICVVGDDDQALYRFRGATVENFVDFPERCQDMLKVKPRIIPLDTNYRSRRQIVEFYTDFMGRCDWKKEKSKKGFYRVVDKDIQAANKDKGVAVIASRRQPPDQACAEVAALVRDIIDQKKVENPNQIAFLYPSLKAASVKKMIAALEAEGLRAYAPRAGRFLEVDEATALFGVYLHIFGKPARGNFGGADYRDFHNWLDNAEQVATGLLQADRYLKRFVEDKQAELETAAKDYTALMKVVTRKKWDVRAAYDIAAMKRPLYEALGLSERAKRSLASPRFERGLDKRRREGNPFTLDYVITAATSIDWNVLDLFYRLCGFDHFRQMFDIAERADDPDEGPICNMGLISQFLARFMDEYRAIITAENLVEDGFQRLFFSAYLFALFRRGESEYEDAEDPFPKGRIPFLTIHQSKGLEFPVAILGNPRKDGNDPQVVEKLVRPMLDRAGEPQNRQAEFDRMRMFYVALSRAENLLVIMHLGGQGNHATEPFTTILNGNIQRIPNFDVSSLPLAKADDKDLPKNYSYTADYLAYLKCPRQYMIFRKYGLVASRSQTMMFGSLIHRTLDDLHQYLIAQRSLV